MVFFSWPGIQAGDRMYLMVSHRMESFSAGGFWLETYDFLSKIRPTSWVQLELGFQPPLLVAHVSTFQSLEIREKTRVDITAHRSRRLECRSASFDQEMNQIIPG